MTSMKTCFVFVLLLALGACKVGPNYQRPQLTVPDGYRSLAPTATTQQTAGDQFAQTRALARRASRGRRAAPTTSVTA